MNLLPASDSPARRRRAHAARPRRSRRSLVPAALLLLGTTAAWGVQVAPAGAAAIAGSPFGVMDFVQDAPYGIRVAGWAIDPDTSNSIPIHVYVDGVYQGGTDAANHRPDVGRVFPNAGSWHGFDTVVPAAGGPHRVCAYAIESAGRGQNQLIGCETVSTDHSPIGALDIVEASSGNIRIAGWALDADTTAPIVISVWVDGDHYTVVAAGHRPDVDAVHHKGAAHGFDLVVPAKASHQTICVDGRESAGGGTDTLIGCRNIEVPGGHPFGAVDLVEPAAGGFRVAGWALDPDTVVSTRVHIYVDDAAYERNAGNDRPDLAAALPGTGTYHGFDDWVPAPTGTHKVCVYALNITGPGNHQLIDCRYVSR